MSKNTMTPAWMHNAKKANAIMAQHKHDDCRLPVFTGSEARGMQVIGRDTADKAEEEKGGRLQGY